MNHSTGQLRTRLRPQHRHPCVGHLWLIAGTLLLGLIVWAGPVTVLRVLAQDQYPAPGVPDILPVPVTGSGNDLAQPYPAPDDNALGIVGGNAPAARTDSFNPDATTTAAAAPMPTQHSPAGLYFLWGSFLAALLIFVTAVVGSVVLFARRVE